MHSMLDSPPRTYDEAKTRVDGSLWLAAMQAEMNSVQALDTWYPVQRVPGMKVLPVRWVMNKKLDEKGDVAQYKARIVAKGFMQQKGVDVEDVYAPVTSKSTWRVLLAFAVHRRMHVRQLDVRTAFLNGKLEEEVYIEQPDGFEVGDRKFVVLKLNRALYGLKQASRVWYNTLKNVVLAYDLRQSQFDPALYIGRLEKGLVFLLTYVDDFLLDAEHESDGDLLEAYLNSKFQLKKMTGQLFLGIRMMRSGGEQDTPLTITLTQETMILSACEQVAGDPDFLKAAMTPTSNMEFCEPRTPDEPVLDWQMHANYRSLVGTLLYVSVCTRPDIAFAVGVLTRHLVEPCKRHWKAALQVLRYLRSTVNLGITYSSDGPSQLECFSDSDWGSQKEPRRSTTGCVFTLAGGAVSWQSKRQQTVSVSTLEAEYQAGGASARESAWMQGLFAEISTKFQVMNISIDNTAAIDLTKKGAVTERSKHIDIIHHFIREKYEEKTVTICHIPSSDNTADVLTKHISPELFMKHRLGMGIKDPPGVVIRELPAPDPVHKPGRLDQPEDFITSDKVGHVVVRKS